MTARCVMVLGTTSGAGKSWLATALCRWYARQGLRVAPFKAQNMSNNARVVARPDGGEGEIGSAQYFQALAARAVPDVRMNPVLLKPEHDTHSQFVLLGRVDDGLSATPWRERGARVWPQVAQALDELRAQNDVVVIEGMAGISNMGGISAQTGKRQGEAGAIVFGGVRDIAHSRRAGYPIWATGFTPVTGKWRIETIEINGEINIGGVRVAPGDIVLADDTGVCFIPRARAAEVLAIAQKKSAAEEAKCKAIEDGTPVADLPP